MATQSTTSLRGEETMYFFKVETGFEYPTGSFTKDADLAGDGETAVTDVLVANILANTQWKYDSDATAGEEMVCMTYNPITDYYSIKEGEYVL